MMDTSSLRIGNIVLTYTDIDGWRPEKVKSLDNTGINFSNQNYDDFFEYYIKNENIAPIELNESMLKMIGFELEKDRYPKMATYHEFEIKIYSLEAIFYNGIKQGGKLINYLHEFQNLFFLIKNKEPFDSDFTIKKLLDSKKI